MCKGRVAGAEDQVRLPLDAQLLAQRCLHVDLAQHAEALAPELLADALDRALEGGLGDGGQCVAGCEHSHSSSR